MKTRITQIFMTLVILTLFCSIIVGIAWLFDSKPNNLYIVWEFLGSCLAVSSLFQLLFGAKINFK